MTLRLALAVVIPIAHFVCTAGGQNDWCEGDTDRYVSRFSADGGSATLTIIGDGYCDCPVAPPWINVTGEPPLVTIHCLPNYDGYRREATVRVGGTCHRVIQSTGAQGTLICWGAPTTGVCDIPDDLGPVKDAVAGGQSTTVLLADGTVRRWGPYSNVPETLAHPLEIYSDYAISARGELVALSDGYVPDGLVNVVEVATGPLHTVALTADGQITCWGNNSAGQCDPPPGLGPAIAVAAGRVSSAALLPDGTVVQWGADNGVPVPTSLPRVHSIKKGWYHTVADTAEYGLRLWGVASWHGDPLTGFENTAYPIRHIATGRAATAVLDDRLHYWGSHPDASGIDFDALGPILTVSLGDEHGVAITSPAACATPALPTIGASFSAIGGLADLTFSRNGATCQYDPELYGNGWLTIDTVVEDATSVTVRVEAGPLNQNTRRYASVTLGSQRFQVVQYPPTIGPAFVAGIAGSQTDVPPVLGDVIQVSCGYGHCLALRSDGTVIAWGNNSHGQAVVPHDLGDAIDIATGQSHSVVLQDDGTVRAWGWNCCGQATPPPDLPPAVDVTASFNGTAAVLEDGTVRCWGSLNASPCTPPDLADAKHVEGGLSHFLVLHNDGTVSAWGWDAAGQTDVPHDLTNVVQVSAGLTHSLALLADGTVRSWGFGRSGEATVPENLGPVATIDAGGEPVAMLGHSVALLQDGSIRTWGDALYASTILPTDLGPASLIDAGYRALFVLRSDCTPDFTADGQVNGADLSILLGYWGSTPGPYPAADLNRDGLIDGADLGLLLGNWGPCQ